MVESSRLPTALKLDMLTFGHAGWLSDWEHLCVESEGHDLVTLEPARSAGVRQVLASVSDERVVLLPYAPDEASALALVERYRLTRVLPLAIELAVLESGGVIMRADERFPAPKSAFLHQGSPYSVTLKPSWRRDRFRFRRSLQLELYVLTPDGVNRSRLRVPQAAESSLLSWLVGAIAARIRSSFIGGR
jgi:hypothetical protein